MKLYALLSCFLVLSGCALLEPEPYNAEQRNRVFSDLLSQGWKLHVHEGKLVLIKVTEEGLYLEDVFGVLEQE